ncbi:MAG: hypothetical protein HYX21_03360 [Candidatus Yanofskybacteria bacterium]|nr:hypothetical protein [Candidatus Yanofskybacteria bacterium]
MTNRQKLHIKELDGGFVLNGCVLLNLALLSLLAVLVVWYAFWANFLASRQYKTSQFEIKLSGITRKNNELVAEKSEAVKLSSLLIFSSQSGLIEQKNTEYVFDRRDVAQIEKSLR